MYLYIIFIIAFVFVLTYDPKSRTLEVLLEEPMKYETVPYSRT